MIKLNPREMKNLSRILSVVLCFAPFAYAGAAGTVATTAGSNLTAYNPSNAMNNQWATMSNGRYDAANAPSAKADFGNCNALILRCAQPKCANGGCSDVSVAAAIVKGCVQSNKTCAQYGDDLVEYMSAQLVASSTAKINEQQMAAQQAAAAAAQQQSEQQMQQMQYQMQQMQQQMAQQQAQSQQQLQEALAQQAAQNQAALESMKTAATESAKETEAGVSAYQQDAINRGISEDVLARQTITGQIMTEIENAETSLKEVRVAMNTAFEYAGCDARGNNCGGTGNNKPKRIKKWRELATEFLTPYDNAIDNIYDALVIAQTVGVDLSQIYMMLNNSCNRWGQYLCPQKKGGVIIYPSTDNGQKGTPLACNNSTELSYSSCVATCKDTDGNVNPNFEQCRKECEEAHCQPCTLVKVLTESTDDKDAVYEGWINADYSTDNGNTSVVACASSALDSSTLFARRTKNKNGAGLVDIDKLDTWLHQVEPSKKYGDTEPMDYCKAIDKKGALEKSALSKNVSKDVPFCVSSPNTVTGKEDTDCPYISRVYAICDAHQYNAERKTASQPTGRDDKNCTEKIKAEQGIQNPNQIIWAEEESGEQCKVKFCAEEYKPTADKKGCELASEDEWKAKGKNYLDAKSEYDAHIASIYGETREIVALKVTVISQQMYKQYEYLNATLRRLKTQLEKAALTATLEAAGAKSESGSSSGGLLGGNGSKNSQYENCSGKDIQEAIYCLRQNYSALATQINSKKCNSGIKKQLVKDLKILDGKIPGTTEKSDYTKISAKCMDEKTVVCDDCIEEYSNGLNTLDDVRLDREARRQGRYRD